MVEPGGWEPANDNLKSEGIGVFVLGGLLLRRVAVAGRIGAELVGQGDLLRPWDGEDRSPALPQTAAWRALTPTRLAVLDEAATRRLARYPELLGKLVGRTLERSRSLAVSLAIVHQPRVDVRLELALWHLAERWGQVTPDGVRVPLALSREALAEVVAARRPTVSTALIDLHRRGRVAPDGDGWLLLATADEGRCGPAVR